MRGGRKETLPSHQKRSLESTKGTKGKVQGEKKTHFNLWVEQWENHRKKKKGGRVPLLGGKNGWEEVRK